jgi:hypothetical protein
MSEHVSVRAYARHRRELGLSGGTHQAVRVAIARGRLESSVRIIEGKPKIDVEAADREWIERTDSLRGARGGNPTEGRPLGSLEGAPKTDARESEEPSVAEHARAAQAIRLTYQAKLAELDYRQRSGELVVAADVALAHTRAARTVRDRLFAIPDRLAARLAAETDPHRCRTLIVGEIDQALGDIATAVRVEA